MTCVTCGGHGVTVLNWSDAAPDYAICLCSSGDALRNETNAGKRTGFALWQVWAYRAQVDPSRVFLMEEVLTPAELVERGFQAPTGPAAVADREAALLAAGKSRRAKL